MPEICESTISWGLYGKEAEEFKERAVARLMRKFDVSKEEAEEATDLWIVSVNEVVQEGSL